MLPTEIPELLKLLKIPINILKLSGLFKVIIKTNVINNVKKIINKSSWFSLINFLGLKILNKIKIFKREISKEIDKILFWKKVLIIKSKELDGKKPPFETNVILKFKLLNNLMLEKFKSIKIKKVKKIYTLEILIILFIKFSSEDRLMLGVYDKLIIL